MRAAFLAVIFLIVFLTGCSRTAVVLWTDVPDIVPAVELFNGSQSEHVVELIFKPELGRALRLAETLPDLVVGTYIEDRGTAELFHSLDRMVRRELDADEFYRPLLETGMRDGHHYLLPISFNLPLMYFTGEVREVDRPMTIGPQELQERGESFNEGEEARYVRIAYSPIWNSAFLYQYVRLNGLRVEEDPQGRPEWPFEAVLAGVSAAREWVSLHGGVEADLAFQQKYLYDPQIRLVRNGRVAYGYSLSDEFLGLTDARREGLGFRWFGTDEAIRPHERVVYTGIPGGALNQDGAERFLVDLFTVERQVELIESAIRKRVNVFGVVGGFSSLWRLNEEHLAEYYPELHGMVPPAGRLRFPPASPRHWGEIVPSVVEPWLVREVTGVPQSRDLEDSVNAWLLQQED